MGVRGGDGTELSSFGGTLYLCSLRNLMVVRRLTCMHHVTRKLVAALACTMIHAASLAAEGPEWSIDVLIGDALNLTSRTRICSAQTSSSAFGGDYETRGLEGPLHYTARLTHWRQDRGWSLELLHHKLFLRNPPQGVEALSISHGFNIVALSRAYALYHWRFRLGLGPVIAHPEVRIAGATYDGDYELAGAAGVGSAGATFALTEQLSVIGEVAATFGYVNVHPRGEPPLTFSVRNPAIHARIGFGYRF
jgi:hypothetical protein